MPRRVRWVLVPRVTVYHFMGPLLVVPPVPKQFHVHSHSCRFLVLMSRCPPYLGPSVLVGSLTTQLRLEPRWSPPLKDCFLQGPLRPTGDLLRERPRFPEVSTTLLRSFSSKRGHWETSKVVSDLDRPVLTLSRQFSYLRNPKVTVLNIDPKTREMRSCVIDSLGPVHWVEETLNLTFSTTTDVVSHQHSYVCPETPLSGRVALLDYSHR